MIEKMTKYSFILLSGQTEEFLDRVRELGVIDITRSAKPVDAASSGMLENAKEVQKALSILKKTDYKDDENYERILNASKAGELEKFSEGDEQQIVQAVLKTEAELEDLKNRLASARRAVKDRKPWGDFNRESIEGLKGYRFRFYVVSEKKFDESWTGLYPLQIISRDGNKVWFVTVSDENSGYSFPVDEVPAPDRSWKEIQKEADSIEADLISKKGLMLKLKGFSETLEKGYERQLSDLDMYLADSAGMRAVEGMVTVLHGFAPVKNDSGICKVLDESGVFYTKDAAVADDNPPIKLRNNWFTRPFEVLTGMYGVPVYGEFDPTPILAPFYLLFFSMCMGDAGYGILLIAIGLFLKYRMADSGLGKMHRLVTLLGVGTLVIGLLLGTFFGMSILSASWAPEWMKALCVDGWFPDGKIAGFPAQMVIAVGVGVVHICLAMIVKSIGYTLRFGFRNTIGTWGWTVLIVGGIIVAGLAFTGIMSSAITQAVVTVLGIVSGLGIFIFNTPGRNPLKNIGAGLWDSYNMVTGLLGDVLSYIRLYALGLAGGMLGNAFNLMGTMILDIPVPAVNWVFCIAILIFGHALNLAMSCLGAFVHPLRLTFVEYFKNSGYEGKGVAYKPLKQSNIENIN